MALSERLTFLLDLNADGAIRGFNEVGRTAGRELGKAEAKIDRVGRGMTRAGAGMMAAGTMAAAGLWSAGQAAGDFGETVSKSEQVFGEASDSVVEFADNAERLLMSKQDALDAASGFGVLAQAVGYTEGESVDFSKTLTTLAADMASFGNANPEEVVLALSSALRGEAEPIRRFGVMLDEESVKLKAVEMGLASSTAEVDNHARVQARLALIMEQTVKQQGDAVRTGDSLANQQKILAADMENLKITIGEAVVPAMTSLVGGIRGVTSGFDQLSPATQGVIGKVAAASTGFLLLGGAASMVIGKVIDMRENFKHAADGLKNMSGATAKGAAAFGLATTAVAMYAEMMGSATQAGKDFAAGVEEDAFSSVTSYGELSRVIDATRQGADDLRESQSGGPIGSFIDADMNRELQSGASNLDNLADKYVTLGNQSLELARSQDIAIDAAVGWMLAQKNLGTEFGTSEEAIAAFKVATGETTDIAAENAEMVEGQVLTYDELSDAIKKSKDNFSDYFDSLTAGLDAEVAWETALDDLNTALGENGAHLDTTTEAGRANLDALRGLSDAAFGLGKHEMELGASADAASAKILAQIPALRGQMEQIGLNTDEQDIWLERLGLTPEQVNMAMETSGYEQSWSEMEELQRKAAALDGTNVTIKINGQNMNAADVGYDPNAFLASTGRSASLPSPAEATAAGGSGRSAPASGGVVVTVNAGMGADGKLIGQQIHEELKKYERAGGPALAVA